MKISSHLAILAAMSGITDSSFVNQFYKTGLVGKVTLGGYSIGGEMIDAAKMVTGRNRKEFILPKHMEASIIAQEFTSLSSGQDTIINLRLNRSEDSQRFARQLSESISIKPIIEINAHCRQPEFLEKGGGHNLLRRPEILKKIIRTFQAFDFQISVKLRGNVIEPKTFANLISNQDIEYIHIDSYQNNVLGTDLELLKKFIDCCDPLIIGNNSVKDKKSAEAILRAGANYFSLARAALNDKYVFHKIIRH
ncbi:MAG: hypothetical protein ACXABI_15175 [Candidatus Hodarchaeales archaeon]